MLEFDFDFRVHHAEGDLARVVEQIWYARGTVPYRRELIAPTGSTVVVLVFGDPITQTPASAQSHTSAEGLVIGPHIAPVENAPHGETFALGVVTTSVGCEAATGALPSHLRGRVTGLDVIRDGFRQLRASLSGDHFDPAQMLRSVVEHVAATVDVDIPGLDRVEQAVHMLEQEPRRPIAEIAEAAGVTHPHLDREFDRVVGLPPRALARLLLLRRILATIDPTEHISWVDVAFENGWSDQAHFSRDFKRHTGVSPTAYLATQRAIAGTGSGEGAGFTPSLDDLR